jgi:hypothetical protein
MCDVVSGVSARHHVTQSLSKGDGKEVSQASTGSA